MTCLHNTEGAVAFVDTNRTIYSVKPLFVTHINIEFNNKII